jgi:diaminopimelate decarboxylase
LGADGELATDGQPMRTQSTAKIFPDDQVRAVAGSFSTPFFLYSVDVIRERMRSLRGAFGNLLQLAVSLKANPNPTLLSKLAGDVEWVDVASLGEYYLARLAGIPASKMLFIGPGKTIAELEVVIGESIGLLVVESLEEMHHIERISRACGKRSNVLLRINPNFGRVSAGIQMSGVASQFGIDANELGMAMNLLKRLEHVCFKGIHVYLGSQMLDATVLANNFRSVLALANAMRDLYAEQVAVIDFGGGFGVPYFPHEKPLDIETLGREVIEIFSKEAAALRAQGCTFLIESGRFLFADAGIYVCSVLYKKQSYGTQYLILDGGSNFHSSLSGLGKLVRANFPFYSVPRHSGESSVVKEQQAGFHLAGPLCTPLDILARNAPVEHHDCGDFIVFEKAGAYGLTFSQEKFLSHTSISELAFDRGRVDVIKRRKGIRDLAFEYDIPAYTEK